jgi:hypothetical protein
MASSESALSRSWRETEETRHSIAWWIAAVIAGAMLGVAGYFVAPDRASAVFAGLGVIVGFFAPYALAVVWNLLSAYGRQGDPVTPRR